MAYYFCVLGGADALLSVRRLLLPGLACPCCCWPPLSPAAAAAAAAGLACAAGPSLPWLPLPGPPAPPAVAAAGLACTIDPQLRLTCPLVLLLLLEPAALP